ncbi:hypothetical protein CEP51_001007 [Fusarium floridanum]|uniref:Prion-inhibition and propagation HeLo domain-containing protein n=1 Tax=Fusarium floridanum TaxID=1325733 RepID=A0A428SJG4_9HYPO|nr:hypothetical protein CEP51_001007 [Fusarium floridanum]
MAETFGAVAGALSVAALFNNCVDCFGYIQLGRHFGRDFERCQLKLDIAWSRLSRWGEAVAINKDPRFAANGPDDIASSQAWKILDQIRLLFEEAQRSSSRYSAPADPRALARSEMTPVVRNLHGRIEDIVHQRQRRTGLRKKFAWALYDSKHLEKLVGDITGLVSDLEDLYPAEIQRRSLVALEIEEVDDELSLLALGDAASGTDDLLEEAVEEKMEAIAARNEAKDILTEETARVKVGNHWSEGAVSRGVPMMDKTENKAGAITARGASIVHIGTSFGGRGIFD